MNLGPTVTLFGARNWLRSYLEEGIACPCCGQFAKMYRRKVHRKMAYGLIVAYREFGVGNWFNLPAFLQRTGSDEAKLRYWGLLEMDNRPGRVGWYRVTEFGGQFVRGEVTIPKYHHVFDGRSYASSGPKVSINDCLGTKFDYAALMRGDE